MLTSRALNSSRAFFDDSSSFVPAFRALGEQKSHLQTQIEEDAEKQNTDKESLFSKIRIYFNEIVEAVINRKGLLNASPNQQGHLDFGVEILDESGKSTSADKGLSYRKLLCLAFDLAVARAHLAGRYPRFVFHDGVLESLDDRKKNLIAVMRSYSALGIQQIITLIDSDLPALEEGEDDARIFADDEVVVRLHDEGDDGRLSRMRSW